MKNKWLYLFSWFLQAPLENWDTSCFVYYWLLESITQSTHGLACPCLCVCLRMVYLKSLWISMNPFWGKCTQLTSHSQLNESLTVHEHLVLRITFSKIQANWGWKHRYWHHIHHNSSAGVLIVLNQSDQQTDEQEVSILSVVIMRINDFSYRHRMALTVHTLPHTHARFWTIKRELSGLAPGSIVSALNLLDCDRPLKGCQGFLNLLQQCTPRQSDWVLRVCPCVRMCIYFLWHSLAQQPQSPLMRPWSLPQHTHTHTHTHTWS